MSAHLSEEEQVEALKRWWKHNGRKTMVAVVLGIGAWWGIGQWSDHQQAVKESSSVLYNQMQTLAEANALNDQQRAELLDKAGELKRQAADSQYGWYAAMMLARLAFEGGDFEGAAGELHYVLDSGASQGLKDIARLRLARVEAARGELAKALELLSVADVGDMAATYAELRGDLYQQQGDTEAARAAYQEAISRATEADRNARDLLDLKLNRVTPAEAPDEQAEAESGQPEAE